jgi:uncharacterized delta-60 repeat protein
MRTLSLLVLFYIVLFKANSQVGSLDSTFGRNGIQTTAFLSNLNTLNEQGKVVLTTANGNIFAVIDANGPTRIGKYLPDGRLDSSYGDAGYSNVVNLNPSSAALQGNKIIVGGYTYTNNTIDFALVRYMADGTLDSSFGEYGKVTTDFDSSDDKANAIALQGDKIVVAGSSNSDFALVRYTADGTLDPSFGVNGLVTTDFNNSPDVARAIALQGDKIVATGYNNGDFALARYTANGTLDSSFGDNGKVTTDFNSFYDQANAIVLQGDKIIAAGYTDNFYSVDFALVRYTANGTLDTSFGEHGEVTTDFDHFTDEITSIVLQGDKIIVAGSAASSSGNFEFALARYTADGRLDSSFGVNGLVTTDFSINFDEARSIALQGNKIIVAGSAEDSVNYNLDFALARYTADGTLDSSFGVNGKLTGYFPASYTFFSGTAIQGNKIVAAGSAFSDNRTDDFALVRYMADGTFDSSFGEHGKVTTDFDRSDDKANAIVLQGDKIIVAGSSNSDFALVRYTADGTLDPSFGKNGKVITDLGGSNLVVSIALQGDKIILAGLTGNYLNSDFALARYTADGVLDSSFGKNGKVTTDFNSSNDYPSSIVLRGDKIIVAGNTGDFPNTDFALARYTADGDLDYSFGKNGKVTTDFDNNIDRASSIALRGDKIIVTGSTYNALTYYGDFALARYTADGALDSSFGINGKVTTDFDFSSDGASSMALQGNTIILAGNSNYNFALARYMADGTLDASFGENGKVITHLDGSSSIQAIALHENRLYAVGSLTSRLTNESYGAVAAYQLEAPEPTKPMVSISDVTVSESKKYAVVTVSLSAPATKWVRVHCTTRDKTALSPQDYLRVQGALLFIPGVNTTFKIRIPLVDDNVCEPTEQFEVLLTNAHNATLHDSIGVVTITDDDKALITKQGTSLHIHASPNPSAGAFTVQLQGNNVKHPVSIRVYDISGRLLEERENISIGQILHLGNQYKAGTYIIEALQGNRSVQTKVIKTGK